jgi:hypothetical protein
LLGTGVPIPPETMMYSLLAGGFGAIVSVLQRLTAGNLTVDPSALRGTQWVLGGARPFLGAALGGVAYLFLQAGLLSFLAVPDSGNTRYYFIVATAFIAGFSERFMQDVIATQEQRSGPPAGVSTPTR